ncbi:S-adenosyl-L-methionine-dependent methyltransferase [Durotheca rogersii]|uniref:S-adenosyl-L-methionine-dependent methyltransferase n=1 Tax=Durotheca rogersii TaxID=419775 RepID=UPI002220B603|nr:S-adenosyl-L-methionine-dependent methyltransferase [Durotheca rogersii]KAI5865248.1 S-adenosyl-L-methionine-dependent methyltransferase [Durotheca rogersii]
MRPAGHPQPPTSSLPPLRSPATLGVEQIFEALDNLQELYCPVSLSRAVKSQLAREKSHDDLPAQPVDSGYVSEDDGDETDGDSDSILDVLRADAYERSFAMRWLTNFIARADELSLGDEEERERAIEKASAVLASFASAADEDDEEEDSGITRDFSFELTLASDGASGGNRAKTTVNVRLHDGPHTTTDHTDVGLQSWGGSIVFSDLVCASPERFGFTRTSLGPSPRVIELGAGTGLASFVLAQALPRLGVAEAAVIATDYHPAVLANLQSNIDLAQLAGTVRACALDWSAPAFDLPRADVLVATDVIYAPEHAAWLRDCASRLLAPGGVFWLLSTVRPSGRFAALIDSVETAFRHGSPETEEGRHLAIVNIENVAKRRGVGRGDESGYKLFRIEWA